MEKSTIIKIIFIILFIVSALTSEFFYRDPLFDNSVTIARAIQKKMSFFIAPLKYYSHLGVLDFLWVFLVFLFFPINYCYTFFLNTIVTVHICNITKLLYGQGRPFLIKEGGEDVQRECEAGYGNPSGHSLQSTSNFLAFAQMMIDLFEIKNKLRIIIYIIVAVLVLLINFSRIILGMHSINQVIFGDTLGFSIFFIIFHIIRPHKEEIHKFFKKFMKIKYHIINIVIFIIISGYITAGAILLKREKQNEELIQQLKKLCKGVKENYMLTKDSIYKSLFIMSYFGMIYGLTLLSFLVKKKYKNKFDALNTYYKNTNQNCFKLYGIRFIIILICFIPFSVKFFKFNYNEVIFYIFCSALPMFLLGFFLFGLNIIANILLKISNKDLYYLKSDDFDEYNINDDIEELLN